MGTLLLRFAAPLQAWGSSSRFNKRRTEREPTKSAVIGLVASALGKRRNESINNLLTLDFGVRIDQPGRLVRDFQTAQMEDKGHTFISHRDYLADAVFVVALESDDRLSLEKLEQALKNPVFPLYLGRRSCPPVGQLVLGIRDLPLSDALEQEKWQAAMWYRRKQPKKLWLEVVRDAQVDEQGTFFRRDVPISFGQEYRQYGFRSISSQVKAVLVENPDSWQASSRNGRTLPIKNTPHDAFTAAIGGDGNVSVAT